MKKKSKNWNFHLFDGDGEHNKQCCIGTNEQQSAEQSSWNFAMMLMLLVDLHNNQPAYKPRNAKIQIEIRDVK